MSTRDEELKLYQEKKKRRSFYANLYMILASGLLVTVLFLSLFFFYFVVRDISVVGSLHYSEEELLACAGISEKDNIFMVSEDHVEEKLKEAFPYIQSVHIDKDYPDSLKIEIVEEYHLFYYEMIGEYYLFNKDLRLIDRYTSQDELLAAGESISVKIPLPISCIVPQYIQLPESCEYVLDFMKLISQSPLIDEVTQVDISDKFAITLSFRENVSVAFGSYEGAENKLNSLYKLIGGKTQNLTGTVDMSDYPNCFYALEAK